MKRFDKKQEKSEKKDLLHQENTTWGAYLKVLVIGIGTALLANILLQLTQNQLDVSLVYQFAVHWHIELFLMSTLVLFFVYLWLTTVTGSKWLGSLLLLLVSTLTGFATYHKMRTQQEPFYPNDLKMIRQLPFLVSMIPFGQQLLLVFTLVGIAGSIYWAVKHRKKKKSSFSYSTKRTLRATGFLISTIALVYVGLFNQSGNKVRAAYDPHAYWIPYSQQMNYYNNGFVGGFLYNLNVDPIERPETYSKEKIQKIKETYSKKASEINQTRSGTLKDVNLVFIMNESFSDPLRLEGIRASDDPIPFIRDMENRSSFGFSLAPSIGGGTANSEFEALTGVSLEPLASNVSSPYTQMVDKMNLLPSVVKRLKKSGHYTTAIHPFNTTMYKRQEVYPELGFDEFLYDKTMTHTESMTSDSFISDKAAYKEVFRVLKETQEKDFVHLVTMQGHMPYANKYDETDFDVHGSGNKAEAEAYFQDLSHSDDAFIDFMNELDSFEEETIVVFWGDHLPGFYSEEFQEKKTNQEMYETPLLIFSNRDKTRKEIGTISPIFFFNHILEQKNVAVTPFQALQLDLEKHIPAFEKTKYKQGDLWKETREELPEEAHRVLDEYTLILFDLLGGELYAGKKAFFEDTP